MIKWVAKLECGHVAGGENSQAPGPGEPVVCPECKELHDAQDVVTNEHERVNPR